MEMEAMNVFALLGSVASVCCSLGIGAIAFFLKKTIKGLEDADKKNAIDISDLKERFNDLKADLPLIYVTREDHIRVMNSVDGKLDKLLYSRKEG